MTGHSESVAESIAKNQGHESLRARTNKWCWRRLPIGGRARFGQPEYRHQHQPAANYRPDATSRLHRHQPGASIPIALHRAQPFAALAFQEFVVDGHEMDADEIPRIAVRTAVLIGVGH